LASGDANPIADPDIIDSVREDDIESILARARVHQEARDSYDGSLAARLTEYLLAAPGAW
jgi:hypothetical protein